MKDGQAKHEFKKVRPSKSYFQDNIPTSTAFAPTMDAGAGGSFAWPRRELSVRYAALLRPNFLEREAVGSQNSDEM